MYDLIDLFIDICLSVVDDFVISQLLQALLRPLTTDPGLCLFATDMVALHDPLDAYFLWCRDHDVDIGETVETALEEDGTLHPFDAAGEKVVEYGRVDDGINRVTVVFGSQQELGDNSLVEITVGCVGILTN